MSLAAGVRGLSGMSIQRGTGLVVCALALERKRMRLFADALEA